MQKEKDEFQGFGDIAHPPIIVSSTDSFDKTYQSMEKLNKEASSDYTLLKLQEQKLIYEINRLQKELNAIQSKLKQNKEKGE